MTVKTKRIAKKVAKHGLWAASDIVFLVLKAMGTVALIAITTGVVFMCIAVIYARTNLATDLNVDFTDFSMSLSSVVCYIEPDTGHEVELATLQSNEYRRYVEYEDIPEHLINALVSIEDHRFFQHRGVDWFRTAGAFVNMFLSMKNTFGGSTITQQLIKNGTQDDDVTVQRKLKEVFRALEYERSHKKEEILEQYLNLVYFGHGCYGIGAAAHYYFNKEVSKLTLAESAAIVGITNNPSMYSPYSNKEANKDRQKLILSLMREHGYISTDLEYTRAVEAPLNFQKGENEEFEQEIYSWFVEAVIADAIRDIQVEKNVSELIATRMVYTGGLKIIATIDPDMQEIVDKVYENPASLPKVTGSAQQLQSGIVIADPYTGEIKALSGGVGVKTRNLLLSRATTTRRPPGSALKPISVYAPAMDLNLISPGTLFEDSADVTLNGTEWMPKNADKKYAGLVDLQTAIRLSLNTTPAIVLDNPQFGPAKSYRFMTDSLGFDLRPEDANYAPLAAGQLTVGATVREMASAFTMFPNAGKRVELRTYSVIYDSDGNVFLDNRLKSIMVIKDSTAYLMTEMLHIAVTSGTGGAANLGRNWPTAGKTGTSSDSKDRWFVGFTPYYIGAVWTGYDMPKAMQSSSNPSAQIWKMIMEPIHANLPPASFNIPENISLPPPVAGVATADCTVTCVDTAGVILKEESTRQIVGKELTIPAPDIEGYKLVSDEPVSAITVSTDPSRNKVVFVYKSGSPSDIDDGDTGEPVTPDPGNTGEPVEPLDPWDPSLPWNTDPPVTGDPNNPGDTGDPSDSSDPVDYSEPQYPYMPPSSPP